jgi:3-hydroxyacyl-CoA dehydrogenase/enoyl-CoA hydratase/3-hydroxybutyryl-CoA epimerase/enoyl-CoA isomerase
MFKGKTLRLVPVQDGFVELCFDRTGESVNKFDVQAINELHEAVRVLKQSTSVRGLLLTSAKDAFIVGADIFEFTALFTRNEADIEAHIRAQSSVFTKLSQLPFPTVAAINGMAFGGGLETALACDYRVISGTAVIGLPEVTLGIIPAYGGSTRLPRIAGTSTALQWITSGAPQKAAAALAAGVVDEVVPAEGLRAAALARLQDAVVGRQDWVARRAATIGLVPLDDAALEQARKSTAKASHHYPAAAAFVEFLADTAGLSAATALQQEAKVFSRLCKTPTAASLVRLFVNDQFLKKKAKSYVKQAQPLRQAAVLGAGIMGGGIAYTSAVRGTPVLMKDIQASALELGMAEVGKLLAKQVESGRMAADKAERIHASIHPQLDFAGFDKADIVVEAIVESLAIKKKVLAEIESLVRVDAVIASNTSSLSIEETATALQRPQNFVGMHFFNPVPQMPLVEVIRGPQTDPVAAATTAGYAVAMGKTPVVVQDCPGFLVNRILTPYCLAFERLIHDGANFAEVDRVMEAFGWPMGPAYLSDVIGMDTLAHVLQVIATGYGARMQPDIPSAVALLAEQKRLGQKSGAGFYHYERDAKGKPRKLVDEATAGLLEPIQPNGRQPFSDEEITDRMMLPMVLEAARCLDEGVAESAIEVDMGLILGLGFPRHLGGVLHWADTIGLDEIARRCDRYAALSSLYQPSDSLRRRAVAGERFHQRG